MRCRLPDLPYLIHTNREPGLMLKGVKPVARVSDAEGRFPELLLRYVRMFDRHVASGVFTRHDEMVPDHEFGPLHHVYFARKGDEWRIGAMIDLLAPPGRWTRERERREGEWLG